MISPGEFWLANIPFTNQSASKRLDCLEQSLLLRRLGAVSSGDAQKLKAVWRQSVQPQF